MGGANAADSSSAESVRPETAPVDNPLVVPPANRRRLYFAGLAAAVWMTVLALLAFSSANPVILNPLQMQQSDVIAVGEVVDRRAGTVEVSEYLVGEGPPSIVVRNLVDTAATDGGTFLLPLVFEGGDAFLVAPNLPPEPKTGQRAQFGTIVYPWSEALREPFEELRERGFRSLPDEPAPRRQEPAGEPADGD